MSIRFLATLVAAALVSACATSQQPSNPSGKMENAVEARATVTAVDPVTRTVSLKEANGDELDVAVTEEVRNFDQIKPGDELVVTYTEALAWQVKPAGQGAPGMSENVEATRAQPGEKPSGTVGRAVTMTATSVRARLNSSKAIAVVASKKVGVARSMPRACSRSARSSTSLATASNVAVSTGDVPTTNRSVMSERCGEV